jgi:hypothetical protein
MNGCTTTTPDKRYAINAKPAKVPTNADVIFITESTGTILVVAVGFSDNCAIYSTVADEILKFIYFISLEKSMGLLASSDMLGGPTWLLTYINRTKG